MIKKNKVANAFSELKNQGAVFYERRLKTKERRTTTYGKIGDILTTLLKYFLLYGLAFVILYPIIQQLAIALRAPEDINSALIKWIPENFSFLNFKVAFAVLDFWESLKNTVTISIIVTIIQLFVTSLVGYALARLKFPGRKLLFVMVIVVIVVAPTTIEIPLKDSMKNFLGLGINLMGTPGSIYALSGLGLGIKSGIFIYLFRQFFLGVPEELEEAAYIDGANPIQVFFKVMLPNARGAIILVLILTFVWQWNDNYFTSVFVTNANFDTLTTRMMGVRGNIQEAIVKAGVYQLFSQNVTQNIYFTSMILNTCAIVSMIPLLIFYVFVQKSLFKEGVERSGLVG